MKSGLHNYYRILCRSWQILSNGICKDLWLALIIHLIARKCYYHQVLIFIGKNYWWHGPGSVIEYRELCQARHAMGNPYLQLYCGISDAIIIWNLRTNGIGMIYFSQNGNGLTVYMPQNFTDDKSTLVQVMTWGMSGNKPLLKLMGYLGWF